MTINRTSNNFDLSLIPHSTCLEFQIRDEYQKPDYRYHHSIYVTWNDISRIVGILQSDDNHTGLVAWDISQGISIQKNSFMVFSEESHVYGLTYTNYEFYGLLNAIEFQLSNHLFHGDKWTSENMVDYPYDYIRLNNLPLSSSIKLTLNTFDEDCKIQLVATIRRFTHDKKMGDKIAVEFLNGLSSIMRIGKNASTRLHPMTIYLQFDSYQDQTRFYPSFYWYILDDKNQRYINGGLIFHPNYDKENNPILNNGNYSIHT